MKPAGIRIAFLLLALLAALPARAVFHLWSIAEIFSSAGGKVQFIEFVALQGGQQFLNGGTIPTGPTSDGQLVTYRFLISAVPMRC